MTCEMDFYAVSSLISMFKFFYILVKSFTMHFTKISKVLICILFLEKYRYYNYNHTVNIYSTIAY